jgi:hypothetical protein
LKSVVVKSLFDITLSLIRWVGRGIELSRRRGFHIFFFLFFFSIRKKQNPHMRNEILSRGFGNVMLAPVNIEIHRDESHRLLAVLALFIITILTTITIFFYYILVFNRFPSFKYDLESN